MRARTRSASAAGTTGPTSGRRGPIRPSADAAWKISRARARSDAMREVSPGWARWLIVSAVVVALDLATKAWVSHALAYGDVVRITPFFNLILTHNLGAAFSFLAGAGGWQRWFFSAIAVVISVALVIMLRRPHRDRVVPLAMALVLGGAIG